VSSFVVLCPYQMPPSAAAAAVAAAAVAEVAAHRRLQPERRPRLLTDMSAVNIVLHRDLERRGDTPPPFFRAPSLVGAQEEASKSRTYMPAIHYPPETI